MAKEQRSLFKRLTRLFRMNNPSISRKIRAQDTTVAGPNKFKSSGTMLFQKSQVSSYAGITGTAYNMAERMMRYQDFQAMEDTAEIGSALDLYSEEAVAADEKGRSLHVYSDNERIKEALDDLFYNTLNIEFNIRPWARNLVKYGDAFLYIDVHPHHGVINAWPIPVNELEREENYDKDNPFAIRFRWQTMGNRTLENWEVAHFRLMGNDLFLPYGSSVLEQARRIWRQLVLIEDAMLVYRVVRAPERRVFYIDVGNTPPDDVSMYIEQQRKNLRTHSVVDKASGRADLRYAPLSVEDDYFIPVRGGETGTKIETLAGGQNVSAVEDVRYLQSKLFAALKIPKAYLGFDEALACLKGGTTIKLFDGRAIKIEDLEHELALNDKSLYAYSYDIENDAIVPGRITKAWKTKEVTELYKITLDDGASIECTENHPFLCRDKTYVRADELVVGQSLMPLYSRKSTSKKQGGDDLLDGYEMLWDQKTEDWKYVHKVSYHTKCDGVYTVGKQRVIHHVDFNKLNNDPSNLVEMDWYSHRKLHAHNLETTLFRPGVRKRALEGVQRWLRSDKHRDFKSQMMTEKLTTPGNVFYDYIHSEQNSIDTSAEMKRLWATEGYRSFKTQENWEMWEDPEYREKYLGDNHWSRKKNEEFDIEWLERFCKENNVTSIKQFRSDHKNSVAPLSPVGQGFVYSLLSRSCFESWRAFAEQKLNIKVPVRGPQRGTTMKFGVEDLKDFCTKHNVTSLRQLRRSQYSTHEAVELLPVCWGTVKRITKLAGCDDWKDFDKFLTFNHKVASIEILKLKTSVGVYDLEVEKYHNFAVQGCVDNDISSASSGNVFVHNSKASLAQLDIRFSRSISVVQKTIIAELNKIAIIHLYALGYDDDDLQNFTIRLSNPSSVAQQQKLELWRAKFEIAGAALGIEGFTSKEFLRKEILALNDAECKLIDAQRAREGKLDAAMGAGGEEGGAAGGGGGGGGSLFGDSGGAPAGGDDLDLTGGAEGGGDSGVESGGEDADTDADEEDVETAGEEAEEDNEPELELLTSADDPMKPDSIVQLKLSEKEREKPVKITGRMKHSLYNNDRRRTHGASKTHMPDVNKMIANQYDDDDPYDNDFLSATVTNPFGESHSRQVPLPPDLVNTLKRFGQKHSLNVKQSKILAEIKRLEDVVVVDDSKDDEAV